MACGEGFEYINIVPKKLPVTSENGVVIVDLTSYDPVTSEEFPEFSSIQDLQDLRFFSNYLKEIPEQFFEINHHLKSLFMCCSTIKPDNGLLRLPTRFNCFSHLEELHLVGNHFEGFPLPICNLGNVKTLYMDNCTLTKIPKEIKNMSSLVVVDFSYNSFGNPDSLPKEFFQLPNVKDLYLIDCQLNELPSDIGGLRNLEGLRIGKNNLTKLPDELFDLPKLSKLSVEGNKISELSPNICQLHSLKLLLIMENRLITLPEEIRNLSNCIHINLFDNKLTYLPRSIIEMPKLETLIVDGNNNLRNPPLVVCSRGLDSIRGYFETLDAQDVNTETIDSQRLEVVLLGESGAGKSSLAYALVHAKALLHPDNEAHSTVGVDFFNWRPFASVIEFHIVDCAGQRGYQLTHPFFLSSEALHILVVDLFKYEPTKSCFQKNVGDWLDLVTSRILKPRIMIVPTHLDKFDPSDTSTVICCCKDILERVQDYCKGQKALIEYEISEKRKKGLKNPLKGGSNPEWKIDNPPIISSVLHHAFYNALQEPPPTEPVCNTSYIAMVPVSNVSELTGINALQDEIIRIAEDRELFPSVGRDLPEEWVKLEVALRKIRENDQVRCMSYEDFEKFAREHTGLSKMGLRSAVTYLDSIGELHYYKDIPSLHKNVFIDLRWLAKLVKCLFRHDLQETLNFDESFQRFGMIRGYFDELKKKLIQEAKLSKALLRCLWAEIELDEAMFLQMVELLHHLGLACRLPTDDPDNFNLLVPWFLTDYPEGVEGLSENLTDDEVEINLLFMMSYLPPGLFDRLRVRCCSLGFDFYNWKDHLLLFGNYERILIHKHSYPAGADSSSPAIYIKGRGIKAELNSLWKILLNIFEETDALLTEWQRLSVQRFALCPPCTQKKKANPCLFQFNWMSSASARKHSWPRTTKICNAGPGILRGEKFDANLIFPPPGIVNQLLDSKWPQLPKPVSEIVPDSLIADLSQKIPMEWKLLASYLDLNADHVATIDQENTIIAEKVIAMFNAWKHAQGANVTRSKLVTALVGVGRKDLAEKVLTYQKE